MSSSISPSSVRSPSSVSISTVERIVHTSSCGSARLRRPSSCAYSNICTWIASERPPATRRCRVSPPASSSLVRPKSHSRSSTGMPTMSAIMCIGSWYATSWTKSQVPRSSARSTIETAHSRVWRLESAHHAGREPGADQTALTNMVASVHADEHRSPHLRAGCSVAGRRTSRTARRRGSRPARRRSATAPRSPDRAHRETRAETPASGPATRAASVVKTSCGKPCPKIRASVRSMSRIAALLPGSRTRACE